MSKKQNKDTGTQDMQGVTDAGTIPGTENTEKRHSGRKPMTEAQKATAKVARGLKELAGLDQFSDPALWASLDPTTLAKIEKAIVHVRTVVHAQERDALKARLAALENTAQA